MCVSHVSLGQLGTPQNGGQNPLNDVAPCGCSTGPQRGEVQCEGCGREKFRAAAGEQFRPEEVASVLVGWHTFRPPRKAPIFKC